MTAAGAGSCAATAPGGASACDSCHFVDDQMAFLRDETRRRGFPTLDGVHMGPCEIHRRHAHTIGPDGALYACPGFAGESRPGRRPHRRGRRRRRRPTPAARFESHRRLARSAATAPSSPCARAAAPSPRTPNSVTCTCRPVTCAASNRRSSRSRPMRRARRRDPTHARRHHEDSSRQQRQPRRRAGVPVARGLSARSAKS